MINPQAGQLTLSEIDAMAACFFCKDFFKVKVFKIFGNRWISFDIDERDGGGDSELWWICASGIFVKGSWIFCFFATGDPGEDVEEQEVDDEDNGNTCFFFFPLGATGDDDDDDACFFFSSGVSDDEDDEHNGDACFFVSVDVIEDADDDNAGFFFP